MCPGLGGPRVPSYQPGSNPAGQLKAACDHLKHMESSGTCRLGNQSSGKLKMPKMSLICQEG